MGENTEIILCFRDKNVMFFIVDISVTLELQKQIPFSSLSVNTALIKPQLFKQCGRNHLHRSITISNNEKQERKMFIVSHDAV